MNPTEQYQQVIKQNLVGETTFLEGAPVRIVHQSLHDDRGFKNGKPTGCAYTVIGVESIP